MNIFKRILGFGSQSANKKQKILAGNDITYNIINNFDENFSNIYNIYNNHNNHNKGVEERLGVEEGPGGKEKYKYDSDVIKMIENFINNIFIIISIIMIARIINRVILSY
jgi:hypothetical protein